MDKVNVSLYCPPMKISLVGWHLCKTAEEPMEATLTFSSGFVAKISKVIIPETFVRWTSFLQWTVDACVGKGSENGWTLVDNLPAEPVLFQRLHFVAQPMDTKTILVGPDGSTFVGSMHYPEAVTNLLGVAHAVTAKGTLTYRGLSAIPIVDHL